MKPKGQVIIALLSKIALKSISMALYIYIYIYNSDITWAARCLKSPAIPLFDSQIIRPSIKENTKASQ